MDEKHIAIEAIRKKLVGKKLTYKEMYAIMDEIAKARLGDILTTYFVASGYSKGFSNEEIYYLTRAMVETGEKLSFPGIVADKHSIGGLPGSRTTLLVVPIVAAAGFNIPKSSSRAITTPAGTADVMEVLAKVQFTKEEIYHIIERVKGCIAWGGSLHIAPADDEIIKVEEPLLFESFDKILISVMAKKIAFGSTHVVIDIPYGKTAKVHRLSDAKYLSEKFFYLAKKFHIKMKVLINKAEHLGGPGIGPTLEAAEAFKVLEQREDRSPDLEKKALDLSAMLLELCLEDSTPNLKKEVKSRYRSTKDWAADLLTSGRALSKMRDIIQLQGGNPNVSSNQLVPGKFRYDITSKKGGTISQINKKNITIIARILGCPDDKKAGMYYYKRLHEEVEAEEVVIRLYSESQYRLDEAIDSLDLFPLYQLNGD